MEFESLAWSVSHPIIAIDSNSDVQITVFRGELALSIGAEKALHLDFSCDANADLPVPVGVTVMDPQRGVLLGVFFGEGTVQVQLDGTIGITTWSRNSPGVVKHTFYQRLPCDAFMSGSFQSVRSEGPAL